MEKKKILVISVIPSHPQNAGNRIRVFNFLTEVKKLGYSVHFLYIDSENKSKHVLQNPNIANMKKEWDEFYYFSRYSNTVQNFKIKEHLSIILATINQIIGVWSYKLYKKSPKTYFRIRKILIGNNQSLFNKTKIDLTNYQPEIPDKEENTRSKQEDTIQLASENKNKSHTQQVNQPRSFEIDDWYPDRLDDFIKGIQVKNQFHAVICEYVFMSKCLNLFNKETIKILDTHDRFADRSNRLLLKTAFNFIFVCFRAFAFHQIQFQKMNCRVIGHCFFYLLQLFPRMLFLINW